MYLLYKRHKRNVARRQAQLQLEAAATDSAGAAATDSAAHVPSSTHDYPASAPDNAVGARPHSESDTPLDNIPLSNIPSGEPIVDKHSGEEAATPINYNTQYQLEGARLYLTVGACLFCLFLTAFDSTTVLVILTLLGSKFNAFDKIGWINAGYMLPICVLATTWGKLSHIFGRKPTMMVSVFIFEVGCLISALLKSMGMLIGGRVVSGIGAGGIQSIVYVVMAELVPLHKRPLVMAGTSIAMLVALVLGPVLGGVFTGGPGWRWCFYINLPIGGAALLFLVLAYRAPKSEGKFVAKLKTVDYLGIVFLSAGLLLALIAVTFGGVQYRWNSAIVIAFFVAGGVLVIVFGLWNFLLLPYPLIPKEVARDVKIVGPCIAQCFLYGAFMGGIMYLSVYFQVMFNSQLLDYSVNLVPMLVSLGVTNGICARIMRKTRIVKPLALFGAVLGCIGWGLILLLNTHPTLSQKIGYLILPGVATALHIQTEMILAQMCLPNMDGGLIMTTTFINFGRALGGTLGSSLAQAIFQSVLSNKVNSLIKNNPSWFTDPTVLEAAKALAKMPDVINYITDPTMLAATRKVLLDAINSVYYLLAGFLFLALVGVMFATNKRMPLKEMEEATPGEV